VNIVYDNHHLIGKLAVITDFGLQLEEQYKKLFGVGNIYSYRQLLRYCKADGQYKIRLMFIDEKPHQHNNLTFFCLKEIGKGCSGDWHWFTLDQLMVCDD